MGDYDVKSNEGNNYVHRCYECMMEIEGKVHAEMATCKVVEAFNITSPN